MLQVCVPKNTVLVVTREKGGFLSVLQSSLSTGTEPDPRLAEVRIGGMHEGVQGKQLSVGSAVHCLQLNDALMVGAQERGHVRR